MRWFDRGIIAAKMLFRRGRKSERLDAELRYHLDRQIAENVAAGMSADEARYAALRSFGNPALLRNKPAPPGTGTGWSRCCMTFAMAYAR